MPILEVEVVGTAPDKAAQALADAAAAVLGTPAGRLWLRLRRLPAADYAENGAALSADELPVFVSVLHARPPEGAAHAAEVEALTGAVAAALGCAPERVHLRYEPAAAGRQAFGGRLVG